MHISGASGSEPTPLTLELTRFGKYYLIASLGQGGMAKVYLALLAGPSDFQKLLVIKILRQDALAAPDDSVRMFWAEARLAARLLHPNIVHTHEVGEQDGRCFLAMEYLEGQPLSTVLNRARAGREIPLDELVRVISEIARGLHYAHTLRGFQGEDLHVVHRDVSPQNLIVTYEGHGKLVDFGIAKTIDGEQTQLGLVKGKLDYIAPEQLRGEQVDARADVFALGAILWEVVSGQRFAGGRKVSDVQKVQARLSASERRLRDVKPDAPAELESIVDRAIALRRADRFQDAASFADALDAYLERENLRPNPRVLAARLSTLFATERAELKTLIESQLERAKSERTAESELPQETTSTDARKRRSGFGLYVADGHHEERSSIRSAAISARASTVAPAQGRAGAYVWLLGLLVAAALLFFWLDGRTTSPSTRLASRAGEPAAPHAPAGATDRPSASKGTSDSSTALEQTRPTAAAPAINVSTVTIELDVAPLQAVVLLDGVRVSLPFRGSFRKDAALHHVDVSASGFKPAKAFVPFDQDRTIEIALEQAHPIRRGARLDQLIDRASENVERHPEPSLLPVPSVPTAPREPRAPNVAPVLERPNPYATD